MKTVKGYNAYIAKHSASHCLISHEPYIFADSMVIPSELQSRLSTIADKLGITPAQTIQALFTWTEMGLSLAEQLSVEDLDPQAVFELVRQLQLRASLNLSLSDVDLTESATFDSHSINQLSTSIRLLSQTLSQKQTSQSDKPHPQNALHDNLGQSPSQSKQPAPPTTTSQPFSPKSKSNRKLSKVVFKQKMKLIGQSMPLSNLTTKKTWLTMINGVLVLVRSENLPKEVIP